MTENEYEALLEAFKTTEHITASLKELGYDAVVTASNIDKTNYNILISSHSNEG